ncbi:MAG: adenylate kinase [Armatimonadetes bacterium]|nr:adenylate kinase [Armatimonadota bacterium]
MAQRDLILLGPPGAGKGTHADYLMAHMSYTHLSTGNLLRAAVASGSDLGKQAQGHMEAGELVPDDLVIDLVGERMEQLGCGEHFLLDGFPRTTAQAEALSEMLEELSREQPLVVNLAVSDAEVVRRLSGRWMCPDCATIYNVHRDGLDIGDKCPQCGGELYRRSDDQPEAIRNRLKVYKQDSAPLIEYYQKRGQLVTVDAEQGQQQVSAELADLARRER